jgi:hypothetical protein
MQQSTNEEQARRPRVRFGVDLHATRDDYRQALWGVSTTQVLTPAETPSSALAAAGTQQSPA